MLMAHQLELVMNIQDVIFKTFEVVSLLVVSGYSIPTDRLLLLLLNTGCEVKISAYGSVGSNPTLAARADRRDLRCVACFVS